MKRFIAPLFAAALVVAPLSLYADPNDQLWVDYKGWAIPSDMSCANAAKKGVVCRLVEAGAEFAENTDAAFDNFPFLSDFIEDGKATRNFAYPVAGV